LLLTQTDKDSLVAIAQQKSLPVEHSIRMKRNFDFFDQQVSAIHSDLTALCKGLAKLVIVDLALSRDQDNPQLIFESMNSTGKELSQADLIRNFILMGLEPAHQTALYEEHWRPMEINFGQEAYGSYFDSFMRHYLTLRTGEIPNVGAVYDAFKAYSRQPRVESDGVDALVRDIQKSAAYYCAMALGKEPTGALAEAFHDLRELKVEVAYPLLLELYDDYAGGVLSYADFVKAVRLVESYVFRRAICAIPTNSLNKTFATFGRSLKKQQYLESLEAGFMLLPTYRRFPNDSEFTRELVARDLYNFRSRSYWLRRLENFRRKERVPVQEYTIEHIMPQNENLSPQWRADLGLDWERVYKMYLHTLGNLTLTGYNSEYSDRSFIEKRDMTGGFAQSPLRLNEGLGQIESWNESAIRQRANRLSAIASEVWPEPRLGADRLDSYRSPSDPGAALYGIADHEYLASGTPTRELFDTLRTEVLGLDPGVTEEFLKLYVAYRAETSFVDVIPRSEQLLLTLNMPFFELQDPRGMARDVANLGAWGNGEVQVGLGSLVDVSYVLGLVRQAFERQMGDGSGSE
ncbi:MAG TPA: DUF262 and DUF1524 domain-containing protein, partial [Candidatus Dormibacteraeota bacterium]|nr:DUF262 and DUF1524 domain-containing protein [Candidatus Dormibacteraeota bacterium]